MAYTKGEARVWGWDDVIRQTDIELMLEVREGDEFAFEELYRRYNVRLLNFFYGLTHDPQVAEDLSHETFARIWHFRHRYAASGSFTSYLFAFARLIGLERLRETRKIWKLGVVCSLDDDGVDVPSSSAFRPDELASDSELGERIREAIDTLPEDQRMVFLMRIVQGMSLDDIAAALNCPVNTVRSRKLLALRKLRSALKNIITLGK